MGFLQRIFPQGSAANRRPKRIPRWGKILIGTAIVFILGIIGINIYLKTTVNKRLRALVHESTNGLYRLDYSAISLNALSGSLTLRDVKLTPDAALLQQLLQQHRAPRFVYRGTAEKFALKNIGWLVYLNSKKLNIGKLVLSQPRFNVTQYLQKTDTASGQGGGLAKLLSKQLRRMKVTDLRIENAMVNYQVTDTVDGDRTVNMIDDLDIELEDLKFTRTEGEPQMEVDDYRIRLKDFKHRSADSLYWIGIQGLDYSSKEKKASLNLFYTQPRDKEREFAKKQLTQETRYQIALKQISAESLDITSLMLKGQAIIKKLAIDSGSIQMFMDRSLPRLGRDDGHVVISKKITALAFPFAIEQLAIGKLDLSYTEFNPGTGESARIPIRNLVINASNITNLPDYINRNGKMIFDAAGSFLNAQIKGNFSFDLTSREGSFTSTITAHQLPAANLSPILSAIAKIETRKGTLELLEAKVSGNENGAVANVNMRYRGLKISMLKKEGDTLKRRALPTMLVNLFVVDDNPKDGVLRTANSIKLVRKPGRSFFNMLWGVIALGIKDIITDKKGHRLDEV